MKTFFKWLLSPVFLVCISVTFIGFILFILVDDGPKAAWRELKTLCEALRDDFNSFFGKY